MTAAVVLDADFLSAFLKIEHVALIRELYQVDLLSVPTAVYREIALTSLLPRLAGDAHLKLEQADPETLAKLRHAPAFAALGAGEQEAIALATVKANSVLLMNDKRATQDAESRGVTVQNIPAFLIACRRSGLLEPQSLQRVVDLLRQKDHFGFSKQVLELLLG